MKLTLIVQIISNGTVENSVTVTSRENDINKSNNNGSSDNVTALPVVDLKINKTVSVTAAKIGDEFIYYIVVVNNGPSTATNVNVFEKLSDYVTLVQSDASKGNYDKDKNNWYIGELAKDEVSTLTLVVKVVSNGTIENVVSVNSTENDSNLTNNEYPSENVTVSEFDTPIDIDTYDITYGDDEIIRVTLPDGATGTVNITVGERTYADVPIDHGKVILPVSDLAGGNYTVNVYYGGDGVYLPNSTSSTFNVARVAPIITIEVEDIWVGETEVINVTVNAPGTVNVTVYGITVTISLDNGVVTTDVLAAVKNAYSGNATWNLINLPVGTYPAFAIYPGNENYTCVNISDLFHVMDRPSTVVVTAEDIFVGQDAIIEVEVGPEGATGNVTITVAGRDYTVNLTYGKAIITVSNLSAGEKEVHVVYNGDNIYRPSENSTTFNVDKIKPPIEVTPKDIFVGDDEPIVVTLPGDATGKVTITVDGRKYSAPVIGGKAIFEIPGLKAGKYTVDAIYSGDEKYLPTSGIKAFKVSKVKPDITIDAPDITVGKDGKVTVTVPDDATGIITIEIDGKRYSAPVKDGKAIFIIPNLKVGKHDIKAFYSGDDKYISTNATGSIKVNPLKDNKTHNKTSVPLRHSRGVSLDQYPTGNPIAIIVFMLLSVCIIPVRKFKK